MNKKTVVAFFSLLFMCLAMVCPLPSSAVVLPVPVVGQLQTDWCWAATSQAVENYYHKYPVQAGMADNLASANGKYGTNCGQYAALSIDYPDTMDWACTYPTPPICYCNQGNYLGGGSPGNVTTTLNNDGVPSSYIGSYISSTDVHNAIYAGNPFIMGWGWTTDGFHYSSAHALVGYGSSGSGNNMTINYMDPWNGGSACAGSYLWVKEFWTNGNHNWIETVKTTQIMTPPAVSLSVSNAVLGGNGNYYVLNGRTFTVTAGITPNGFMGVDADWWFIANYHGVNYHWINGSWIPSSAPTWQKPLALYNPTPIWSSSGAVGDTVTFYVGVDLTKNGTLDDPIYYKAATVIVY